MFCCLTLNLYFLKDGPLSWKLTNNELLMKSLIPELLVVFCERPCEGIFEKGLLLVTDFLVIFAVVWYWNPRLTVRIMSMLDSLCRAKYVHSFCHLFLHYKDKTHKNNLAPNVWPYSHVISWWTILHRYRTSQLFYSRWSPDFVIILFFGFPFRNCFRRLDVIILASGYGFWKYKFDR